MLLFKILAWLVLVYGIVATVLRLVKIEHDVPDGTADSYGSSECIININ